MKVLSRQQIEELVSLPDIIEAIEKGFIDYSHGKTVIPPVGTLHFEQPPGICHIKYGYATHGKYYVVKIASGFPENPRLGLPTGRGLMLLFDKQTGTPVSLLQDECYLTELRTAVAGCIAAKYLAPKNITCIGIVGTGTQAYYQLKLLAHATDCRQVFVWGRDRSKAQKLKEHPHLKEWEIRIAETIDELTENCNLIVTTTNSDKALLFAHQIRPGTHITAVGTDAKGKQELDPELIAKANKVIVDSRRQCVDHGDCSYAINAGLIQPENLIELGQAITNPQLKRTSEEEITIADLTGVAIQDLQIATAIYEKSQNG